MSNFTKKAIEDSFLKLLDERPVSQISVKDIVTDCGVNRNTFYYYFEDIPKLCEEIATRAFEGIMKAYPTVEKIEDLLEAVFTLALSKKRAILHVYNSVNVELFERYLWKASDYVVEIYVNSLVNGRKLDEKNLAVVKKYLSAVGFGLASDWFRKGMKEDGYDVIKRLCAIEKGMTEEMLARCAAAPNEDFAKKI